MHIVFQPAECGQRGVRANSPGRMPETHREAVGSAAMKQKSDGALEQDSALGQIASAEAAAKEGEGPTMLQHLASAGQWALPVAEEIGVGLAVEAIKRAMGM